MKKQQFQDPGIETDHVAVLSRKLIALTNELTESNRQLELAEKEKNDMISNISHDLRAPITAIRSALDLMMSGQELSSEEMDQMLRLINHRTQTLEHIIQEMYVLFTLKNDEQSMHYQTISAIPFFQEYYYNIISDAQYEEREMSLDLPEEESYLIDIDVQKIIRVLDNLFTNTLKYSTDGDQIRLALIPSQTSDYIHIQVSDSGIGIPKECVPKIFDRTFTVSDARTPNSTSGSGLGLSIAKTIVEKHQGIIFCESEMDQGTTFTFSLPLSKKEEASSNE